MLFASIFFLVSWLSGISILGVLKLHLPNLFKHPFSTVAGSAFLSLTILFFSLFFGLSTYVSYSILLVFSSFGILYFISNPSAFKLYEAMDFKKNSLSLLCLFLIFSVIALLFHNSLITTDTSIIAGNRLVWTDWPIHFAIISSFVKGNNFPPQNPLHSGMFLTYPFFSDFLSAVLQTLGVGFKNSLTIPGMVLGFSFVLLLHFFGKLITSTKVSLVAIIIGLFWGGIGFYYFFQDVVSSTNWIEVLTYPPREYTFFADKNLWFFSFLYSEILPQRSFLFGLPFFFSSLSLFILGITKNKKSYIFISALIFSFLPFFHFHSFLSLAFFLSVFIPLTLFTVYIENGLQELKKNLINLSIYFILPALGILLIQFPLFSDVSTGQIIHFNWGWMKGQENFFLFWFKNTGFFWPLFILGAYLIRNNSLKRNIAIATSFLFIIPNVISFAPWPYDNLKILTYWYLIASFFVSYALMFIFKKGNLGKGVFVLLFISLTLSGTIEVFRVFNTTKTQVPLFSAKDFEIAQAVINNTVPKSTILTAAIHDHPVSSLAGRKQVIGFPGNSWAWGLSDWSEREQDVRKMLRAEGTDVPYLLAKYHVDYVLISPRERFFENQLNEKYYQDNATLITAGEDYKLYSVR